MGLFNKLGRKAERLKQQVEDAATEACPVCGAEFAIDHDTCPECGRTERDERIDGDRTADESAD